MYPRFIEGRLREALADTRVVLITGPRQSGKTTLARKVADTDMPYVTLDDQTVLDAASADPVGFLRTYDRVVIDEVQRAPGLLLAIKAAVDLDPQPGKFLLTGSANFMTLPKVADSLAGRMSVLRLLPLAQAELKDRAPTFLDQAFGGVPPNSRASVVGEDLIRVVLTGGYPEVIDRSSWRSRNSWLLNYVQATIDRNVQDVAQIEQMSTLSPMIRVLAEFSGKLVNYSNIGRMVDINHVTTRKYMDVLERLFLVHSVPRWYTNNLKRLTKSPKLHFFDSGLLASMRNLSPDRIQRDKKTFGAVLETFVFTELAKHIDWSDDYYTISHFRDRRGNEVDFVLENLAGEVVGIEVKAAATVSSDDFSALRYLASVCDHFVMGIVLYDHDRVVSFGDNMYAIPISALWYATGSGIVGATGRLQISN